MHTTAILLAGGEGSRMNYSDKAWVTYKQLPLILHVINRIRPQVDDIIISRNSVNPMYDTLPYQCVSDGVSDGVPDGLSEALSDKSDDMTIDENNNLQGPLGGIVACLPHIKSSHVLIVPCDTPDLPSDLVSHLQTGLTDDSFAVAHDGTRMQQLILLAEKNQLESISDYLASGRRSVMGWIKQTSNVTVKFDGKTNADKSETTETFKNINSVNQLE